MLEYLTSFWEWIAERGTGALAIGEKQLRIHKGYEVLGSHDRLCPEGTHHIEVTFLYKIDFFFSLCLSKEKITSVLNAVQYSFS